MPSPISIQIESLAAGGDGVGHIGNAVCFVPYAAPGDTVAIDIVKRNKKFLRGRLRHIVTKSPLRISPICPLFETCGGCQWLHLTCKAQHQAKQQILARALHRPDIEIVPSPKELEYRAVARFHVGPSAAETIEMGFTRARDRLVVPVSSCPILEQPLVDAIFAVDELRQAAEITSGEIKMVLGDDGPVACFYTDAPLDQRFYEGARKAAGSTLAGVWVRADSISTPIAGKTDVATRGTDGHPLVAPAPSFGQANRGINRIIADTIREWLAGHRFRRGVEMFAGAGNHTIAIAPNIDTLISSEIDPDACRAMNRNLCSRGLNHVSVQPGESLEIYRQKGGEADLVVLNPPRTGHHLLARAIADGNHQAILYISCNPATLARDLETLCDKRFFLEKAIGFDMFPQTAHMEAMVLLRSR
jgi:23S rRNA (uracil1939-C5)-methyltransferase